jgi:hypothetical protein
LLYGRAGRSAGSIEQKKCVANAGTVSHEAELHQVKLRQDKDICGGQLAAIAGVNPTAKTKAPRDQKEKARQSRAFDEFLF